MPVKDRLKAIGAESYDMKAPIRLKTTDNTMLGGRANLRRLFVRLNLGQLFDLMF